jgi:hypothetical protein
MGEVGIVFADLAGPGLDLLGGAVSYYGDFGLDNCEGLVVV